MEGAARAVTFIAALLAASVLVVSPSGPYTSIEDALAAASPGDTIEVHGGTYGPLVIDKSVTLVGSQGATIDGGGEGDVVRITAPGVTLQGFEVRGSGRILDREHAGVTVLASDAVIRDNRLRDVLFGVFLKESDGSLVEANDIRGYPLDTARRGDGIRSWYSQHIVIRDNRVSQTRDVIFWFSTDALIEGNHISDGRYGLHFMYDDGLRTVGNTLEDNSVGIFAMYSSNVRIEDNLIRDSGGPSGYGIGLKEIANLDVSGNVLIRNRIGISFDTVPHGIDAYAHIHDNLVAFNTFGLSFQPSTERVELLGNSLERNGTQVEVRGSGDLLGNTWTQDRGNYWSDYAGYDADRDGLGDLAYEPRSLFDSIRDTHPILGFFGRSPASIAVDLAARAAPDLQPSPRVVDTAPLMSPQRPAWFEPATAARWPWMLAGAGFVGLAAVVTGAFTRVSPRNRALYPDVTAGRDVIRARGVTKRYGATAVLDAFDLDVRPGEAVALWGANGAGKTTALKCLLGLVRASGEIAIGGVALRRDVRLARARMGYVPQDLDLPDLPTRSLVDFFSRVRGAEAGRTAEVLALVRLTDHAEKRPSELSGGLRQRLALALALVGRPSVLLLDEPTANLDQESRHVMFDVLRHQREQGVAVLFTTHRVDEVVELADRVVTLEMGRVSREEAVDDFARTQQQHQGVLVRVADGEAAGAEAALTASGYAVERRTGEWILVRAAPIHHVVSSLLDAGIEMLEVVPRGDA